MYNSPYTSQNKVKPFFNNNPAKQYLQKEIMEASPEQLVIKAHDLAIGFCQKQNIEKTNAIIREMSNYLRYDDDKTRDLATGLNSLYEYCQEAMRQGLFDKCLKVLQELRNSWITGFKNLQSQK